jgi:hypothetical protein
MLNSITLDIRQPGRLARLAIDKIAAVSRFRFRLGLAPTRFALVATHHRHNPMDVIFPRAALVTNSVGSLERRNELPPFALVSAT